MNTSSTPPGGEKTSCHVAEVLQQVSNGDQAAAADMLPLVYDQLRALAQQRMMLERPGHTLQATALVHEVFLKLVGPREIPWARQAPFVAAAAEAMRRILLDHAPSNPADPSMARSIPRIGSVTTNAKISVFKLIGHPIYTI